MDATAPGSQLAPALPAAVATGCAVLLAGLIARELGCDRRAQVLTALAQATALWTTLPGHWLTPYSLEPAQWLLLVWLLVRWVRRGHGRVSADRTTPVVEHHLGEGAHVDGLLNPPRGDHGFGTTNPVPELAAEGV
jgi:hypothetical protein